MARLALYAAEPPSVRALAARTGLGTRRVQAVFAQTVGAGPKLLMRVGRFQRALRLARESSATWAAIAARCGYFDHAHLVRDAQQFAGRPPSALFPERATLTEVFVTG